ncbi:hypothetical protein F0562_034865 [Nyssa sinensis]|uniref:Uncharacterized protein n=1 Tax=Nyssa sinensis TaxID=561372 RepID=A0A5J5AA62_9ASTE|nr:hypothetical protein F0562_034865 [Nyssa sinensis]
MASEQLMYDGRPRLVQKQSELLSSMMSSSFSFHKSNESIRIFYEFPKATIVSVSRPDAGDISPMLLSYTIEVQYKQFKWQLLKKASQVFFLHFALKKSVFIKEINEKQEQVREWLQNIGIGDHTVVVQDDDEPDDETTPLHQDESTRNRDVPSSAALPIIRPALGRQHSMSDRAKVAMQGYLSHFLGNMDIVNSREESCHCCHFCKLLVFEWHHLRLTYPKKNVLVPVGLQDYSVETAIAVIVDGSASLKIDTQHLSTSLRVGSIYQFIGELLIQPNNEMIQQPDLVTIYGIQFSLSATSAGKAMLKARVGRNVDGMDLNLYHQSLQLLREFQADQISS